MVVKDEEPTLLTAPPYGLASDYCRGKGLEIGRSAGNLFPVDALNVSCPDEEDFRFWRNAQLRECGYFAKVDTWAEADALPVQDCSQDFIVASHAFEHLPNPIKALHEWHRVVRPDGHALIIIPQPTALLSDQGRSLTTLQHCLEDFYHNATVETHPREEGVPKRGHLHLWTLKTFADLIFATVPHLWQPIAAEDPDAKCGNGFAIVLRRR